MRVLIFEDDPLTAKTLTRALAKEGHTVIEHNGAGDPGLIRDVMVSAEPDAIITDWRMPGFTGQAVLDAAKATLPWWRTRVAVHSGESDLDADDLGVPLFRKGASSSLLMWLQSVDRTRAQEQALHELVGGCTEIAARLERIEDLHRGQP